MLYIIIHVIMYLLVMLIFSYVIMVIYKGVSIMTLKLKYIVEVAKLRSINKAAQSLNITQPAISHAIHKFESEVGFPIFRRSKLGTFPTSEGRIVIEKAMEVLEKVNELEMLYSSNTEKEKMTIVSTPGVINLVLKVVAVYSNTQPNLDLFISEVNSEDIIEKVIDGTVDAGLLIYPEGEHTKSDTLSSTFVEKVKIVAAVKSSSFYDQQGFINYSDLKKERLVLYEDKSIREFEADYIAKNGDMNIFFRTKNAEAIFIAIQENNVITIGHDYAIKASQAYINQKVKIVEVKGYEQHSLEIGWLTNKRLSRSRHVSNFIKKFDEL